VLSVFIRGELSFVAHHNTSYDI